MLRYKGGQLRGEEATVINKRTDKQKEICAVCQMVLETIRWACWAELTRWKGIKSRSCRTPDGRISSISVGMTTYNFNFCVSLQVHELYTLHALLWRPRICCRSEHVRACFLCGWHYLQSPSDPPSPTISWCLTLQSTATLQWLRPVLGDIDCPAPHRWASHNADEWTPGPAKSN